MDPKTGEVATHDPKAGTHKPGGEPQKNAPKVPPQFTAREQIAKRREADRQAEMKEFKVDVQDEDGNLTAAPIEAEAPTEQPTEPLNTEQPKDKALETAPVEKPAPALDPEEQREIIVNGKRMTVPLSKIIEEGTKTLQKESAADMKLAAASELERQLQARLANYEQPPKGAVQEQPKPAAQPSDEDAALAKAIQFGSEEEARTAIAKLRNADRGMTKDEAMLFVRQTLASELPKQNAFEQATNWVRNEHKEIFADPDMEQMFMLKETQARQAGDKRPYQELYKELAEGMETKFQLRRAEAVVTADPATTTAEPAASDRILRKANAPRIVSGASGKTPAAQAPKQMSVTDYVQRQRELRGLQPLNRERQGI